MAVYDFGDGICDLPPTLPPGLDDLNFVSAGFFRIQMQHGVDLSHLAKINHLAVVEIRVKRDLGFQRVRAELNRKPAPGAAVAAARSAPRRPRALSCREPGRGRAAAPAQPARA